MDLLRPYGIVIDGELRLGLEILRREGLPAEVRPHTGIPDDFVLTLPFVNAHSHLEYRALQGELTGLEYWAWIRELTARKANQSESEVAEACRTAAFENLKTGVAQVLEHSDRPFAGEAMTENGLDGIIFQEVITFFERDDRDAKLEEVEQRLRTNQAAFRGRVELSPHSVYTVDPDTLAMFGSSERPFSIHLAESIYERAFFVAGEGPIADFYHAHGVPFLATGKSAAEIADGFGLLRPGAQLVHCCDLSRADVALVAGSGATVAHCPRSNEALGCPGAPIRELLDAGVDVSLGMDSAASSGPIDMFAEMRAALSIAENRGLPLKGEEVWRMATGGSASSEVPGRESDFAWRGRLLAIDVAGAQDTEDLISRGTPEAVRWIA